MNALEQAMSRAGDRRKLDQLAACARLGSMAEQYRMELWAAAAGLALGLPDGELSQETRGRLRVEVGRSFARQTLTSTLRVTGDVTEYVTASLLTLRAQHQEHLAREVTRGVGPVTVRATPLSPEEEDSVRTARLAEKGYHEYILSAGAAARDAAVEELRRHALRAGTIQDFLARANETITATAAKLLRSWTLTLHAFAAAGAVQDRLAVRDYLHQAVTRGL